MPLSIARWMAIVPLFAIPFIPLYVANDLFFPYITGKAFAFRLLVEFAAAGWVLLVLSNTAYRPKRTWVLSIYFAFTAWMFIANLFAIYPEKAFWSNYERMEGWVTLAHLFMFFVITSSVLTVDKLWRRWWLVFVGVSAIVCGNAVLQLIGIEPIHQSGVRVDATIGNAAYFASYLLFAIPITAWLAYTERYFYARYALAALAALQTIILFYTATRGALLGVVAGAIVATTLIAFTSGKRARKYGIVALSALLLVLAVFFALRSTPVVMQDATLSRLASISLEAGNTRFALWNMAAKGVAERPLTGYGQEGFIYVFSQHFDPRLYQQEPWFDRAHNIFVDWMVAGGVPALMLFVGLLVATGVALMRAKDLGVTRYILVGGLSAYVVQGLFVFDNLMSYIPLVALVAFAHTHSSSQKDLFKKLPVLNQENIVTIATPIVVLALFAVVYFVNIPSISAAKALIGAINPNASLEARYQSFDEALRSNGLGTQEIREQLIFLAAAVSGAPIQPEAKEIFLSRAIEEARKQVDEAPLDARTRVMYVQALKNAGRLDEALQEAQKARELAPKKQTIVLEQGFILWRQGAIQDAQKVFMEADSLAPGFADLAGYVAAAEIALGDTDGADARLMAAFGTTTVDHPMVIDAYMYTQQYDELVPIFVHKVNTSPNDPRPYFQLSTAYAMSGRIEDARAVMNFILSNTTDPTLRLQATTQLQQIAELAK